MFTNAQAAAFITTAVSVGYMSTLGIAYDKDDTRSTWNATGDKRLSERLLSPAERRQNNSTSQQIFGASAAVGLLGGTTWLLTRGRTGPLAALHGIGGAVAAGAGVGLLVGSLLGLARPDRL